MVNPLNIILPFLFRRPRTEGVPYIQKHYQSVEEFVCVLRRFEKMPDDDLAGRIWTLAVRLSNASSLDC